MNIVERRRRGLSGGETYTFVNYIESHGTEYIATNWYPKTNSKIECTYHGTSETETTTVFGTRTSPNNKAYYHSCPYPTTTSNVYVFMHNGNGWTSNHQGGRLIAPSLQDNTIVLQESKVVVNSTTFTPDQTGGTKGDAEYPMYICTGNNGGTPVSNGFIGRIYSFKGYDGTTLKCDFVPCVRNNQEVGLWDNVSQMFYTNQGTGAFTYG